MSDKIRYSRADALAVARDLCEVLAYECEPDLLKVCGSLRRRKESVGDVEIVYVPRVALIPEEKDLLGSTGKFRQENRVDVLLEQLLAAGHLAKRPNKLGRTSWGESNKLAVHVASGIPVDLFATTRRAWWGYVVCRTGSAETNTRIASQAQAKGWQWHPYDGHFTDVLGRRHWIENERDAFALVGLPYREPWER
ncbi:MAG: hypothetical protein J0M24_13990 [Verrucomicrobia bacterium]|nr:hypothetical protein [Verrucomicrobiota bacterium]